MYDDLADMHYKSKMINKMNSKIGTKAKDTVDEGWNNRFYDMHAENATLKRGMNHFKTYKDEIKTNNENLGDEHYKKSLVKKAFNSLDNTTYDRLNEKSNLEYVDKRAKRETLKRGLNHFKDYSSLSRIYHNNLEDRANTFRITI
jgi:hypothetical protein